MACHITSYLSQVQIFLNGGFSRIFSNLEIHDSSNGKSHMSYTSYKVNAIMYMSIWTPVIDKMLVCKRGYRCNIHYPFTVVAHKVYNLVWPDSLSYRAFIICSISTSTQPLKLLWCQQQQLQTEVFCCLLDPRYPTNQA